MNDSNLKRLNSNEAREFGKKGGLASGNSRKKKKKLQNALRLILSLEVSDKNKEILNSVGLSEDEYTNEMLLALSLFQNAIKGDVGAMRLIAEICGVYSMTQKEKEHIELEKERIELSKQKNNISKEIVERVIIVDDL